MKTSEVLTKAKELIATPDKWYQGDYTNNNGCFCALGAIGEVSLKSDSVDVWYYGFASESKAGTLLRKVVDSYMIENGYRDSTTFAVFNDNNSHDDVMSAFDKAIELAKAEED
jgi:hypothetical protein